MSEFYERLQQAIKTASWVDLVRRRDVPLLRVDPAILTINFPAMAAGAAPVSPVPDTRINANCDFACMFFSGSMTDSLGAGEPIPNVRIQLTDRNTQQNFFSEPVLMANVIGSAGFPFMLPAPYVFRASTSLTWTLSDMVAGAGVTPWTVQVAMIGAKLYYAG